MLSQCMHVDRSNAGVMQGAAFHDLTAQPVAAAVDGHALHRIQADAALCRLRPPLLEAHDAGRSAGGTLGVRDPAQFSVARQWLHLVAQHGSVVFATSLVCVHHLYVSTL